MDMNAFHRRLRLSGGTSLAALIIGIIIAVVANVTVSVKYLADNYNSYKNFQNPYNSYPFPGYDDSDYDSSDYPSEDYFEGGSSPNDPSPGEHESEAEADDSFPGHNYSTNPKKDASKSPSRTL
jgi:hypothetical protein